MLAEGISGISRNPRIVHITTLNDNWPGRNTQHQSPTKDHLLYARPINNRMMFICVYLRVCISYCLYTWVQAHLQIGQVPIIFCNDLKKDKACSSVDVWRHPLRSRSSRMGITNCSHKLLKITSYLYHLSRSVILLETYDYLIYWLVIYHCV